MDCTRVPKPDDERRTYGSEPQTKRTPLPLGQLCILFFLRFCESASMSVIFPFLNELLSSMTGTEEKVGYYAGIMVFMPQAVSLFAVMFWSRLSDHIGRKPVLVLGTFALSVSMFSFGLASIFWVLVVSRCIFPMFNSNAGVIKGMIGEITDESNRPDSFALLHVPWAGGFALGALIGGWLAKPHDHFPSLFRGQIWADHPFFLPCLTLACCSLLGCVIALLYLKETISAGFFRKRRLYGIDDEMSQPLLSPTSESDKPLPLRSLLCRPILLACTNYCILGALHTSSTTLQPLLFAMSISNGGLALPPYQIGYIMGVYGLVNACVQTFLLGRFVRSFGLKNVFVSATTAMIPIFVLPPVMNMCLRKHGWDDLWWNWFVRVTLTLQVGCGCALELGYGSIYMFINASAPNRRSLGAVNGLAQTLVSVGRLVVPTLASSLLSFSIENPALGGYGYLAYGALTVAALGGIAVALQLPELSEGQ